MLEGKYLLLSLSPSFTFDVNVYRDDDETGKQECLMNVD